MRLAVTGATGHMGRAVLRVAAERGDTVALAVNRDPPEEAEVGGVPVEDPDELAGSLADRTPDALVDFTGPASSVAYVEACARAGVPAVVGTTGFEEPHLERLEGAADETPVLRAPNFARGVQALKRAVREAVRDLPGYDIEVTETHHSRKRDAPSGTAGELLEAIEAERTTGERVHGRAGEAPRADGELGVHARRAGDVTGEHEVLLADNHEVLTLCHRAESREVFAAGALDAAAWLRDRDPGFYEFGDVVGDR